MGENVDISMVNELQINLPMVRSSRERLLAILGIVLFTVGCGTDLVISGGSGAGSGTLTASTSGGSQSTNESTVTLSTADSVVETSKSAEGDSSLALEELSAAELPLTERPDICQTLVVETPRGLSCIHCLNSNAEVQREVFLQILLDTCLKNVALSYLVDGSFGSNFAAIEEDVATLVESGRTPFIHIYLLNGPSQRRYRNTPISGLFTRVSPERFRSKLKSDGVTREQIGELVSNLVPTLNNIVARGGIVSLVPMLEDNLDDESFVALTELVLSALPADLNVSLGRNSCKGCYRGNENGLPNGLFEERHSLGSAATLKDGVISNDGKSVAFGNTRGITLTSLAKTQASAAANNSMFLFWHAPYQGLQVSNGNVTGHALSPQLRSYAVPTSEESAVLVKFLQGN